MHQALYRKYRPRTFEDVCGQDHITSVLKWESENGKFSHAYLFCGPRGTGKTTCAKILAKAINCEDPKNGDPCGKCPSCIAIDEGRTTDVIEMDAASNNGVEYIREIRDEVNYTPAHLKKKVYIIDEVHMLSTSAFNALLKTLEEPPEHVVFILATTELHKLLATIISRCQRFDFRRIKTDVIADRLMSIAGSEGLELEREAAVSIAKQAQGGMRDAISTFELCSAGGVKVTKELVIRTLGLAGIEQLYKTAYSVSRNDPTGIFRMIHNIESSSKDIAVYWSELCGFWRDMMVFKYLPESERNDYLDLTEPEMRLLADASRRFTPEVLTYHMGLMDEALREMARLPATKRITAETTLLRMADRNLDTSSPALLSRISELEVKLSLISAGSTSPAADVSLLPPEEKKTAPAVETPDEVSLAQGPVRETAPADTAETSEQAAPDSTEKKPSFSGGPADISEALERISESRRSLIGPLEQCRVYVSDDRKHIAVGASKFTLTLLKPDVNSDIIKSALIVTGVADPGADLEFRVEDTNQSQLGIDDLLG
jgi:DNA polymerase-3 subunit gamma/tau